MCAAYLGIGSNIGDRLGNLDAATRQIGLICEGVRRSQIYETLPRYELNQPRFLNAVLQCKFNGTPDDLLTHIKEIESRLGRDRALAGWKGPRTIDIDILLFGAKTVSTRTLTIPHPLIAERKFVLIPLLEIKPLLKDPVSGTPYYQFLASLEPQGIYYHSLNRYIQSYAHGSTGQSE